MRYLIIFISVILEAASTLVVDANPSCLINKFNIKVCFSCENTLNPYTSIQDAVDNARNGDIIKICKGTYKESVIVRNYVSLTFEGAKDVKKPTDVKWSGNKYALMFEGNDLILKNLYLEGKYPIKILRGYGDYNFSDLELNATDQTAIYISSGNNLSLVHSKIYARKYSIFLDTGVYGNYIIKDTNLTSKNSTAIYIKKGRSFNFSNLNILAGHRGIRIREGGNFQFLNSSIKSKNSALDLDNTGNYVFKNLSLKSLEGVGLQIGRGHNIELNNVNIISNRSAISIGRNVYGNYLFSNLNLNSNKSNGIYIAKGKNVFINDGNISSYYTSILLANNVYGDYNFLKLTLNSKKGNGIHIYKGRGFTLTNSKVFSKNSALFLDDDVYGDYYINNVEINSSNKNSIYVKSGNSLTITNSCLKKNVSSQYDLLLKGYIRLRANNNCFFGNPVDSLAKSNRVNNVDPGSNYWEGVSGGGIYDYNNIIDTGTLSSCPNSCWQETNSSTTNANFNAVTNAGNNAVKDWDNNLSVQTINKTFSVWILSKNENNHSAPAELKKVGIYLYPNSECSGKYEFKTICENNCSNTNLNGEVKIENINIANAYKCAKVYVQGRLITSLTSDYQEANSSDRFAIKPKSFQLKVPLKGVASKNFEVNISLLDNNNNLIDYNGTLNLEIDLNASKTACNQDDKRVLKSVSFTDGIAGVEVNYSNVADLNVTVKEGNPIFADIDAGDGVSTNLEIEKNSTQLKVIPKYFEVNATLSNFDKGFTYLDKKLNAYAVLDVNVTAKGEENNTLTNYSDICYGSDINLSFDVEYNEPVNLKILITNENNFSIDEINTTLNSFSNGVSNKEIHFNYDKNYSNPIAPFEVKLKDVNLIQKDVNSTLFNSKGNATFYYGNLILDDVVTTNNEANNSAYIVAYSTFKNKEISFNWFLNPDTTTNILNVKVMPDYEYNSSDEISSIIVTVSKSNGRVNFDISNIGDNRFFVIHILDSSLSTLWYSKFENDYNVSDGSTCLNHFCFAVSVEENQTTGSAGAGNFKGTEVNITKNRIIAPKIYR